MQSCRRSDLVQRLAKQEFSIWELARPMDPKCCSLCFKPGGFVRLSGTEGKVGESRPGAGNTGGIAEIVLQIGSPGDELVQQLMICVNRFGRLARFGIGIGLGS